MQATPSIIVVAGPTAVGKTAAAIQLAKHFDTCIISADSRQCYRELNIGVARPSPEELATVPHYFIASHSIHQKVDVAVYEQYALQQLQSLFAKHSVVIVAGGTGLYLKALCEGIDAMPEIPAGVREQVRQGFYQHGTAWLQEQLNSLDPLFAASGEMQNPHRMMRALEFVLATGQSIKTYQKGRAVQRPFNIIKIGLELPRETLVERVHQRVDIMMEQGLEAEVESLSPYQHLQALQTVGYSEIFDHYKGLCSLEAAVEFIKTNTRQYAKRQMTWFKKDTAIEWFAPDGCEAMIRYAESKLS